MKNIATVPGKIDRTVRVCSQISKNYLVPTISLHARAVYAELGLNIEKDTPKELIAYMGIKKHRWTKIINESTDILFSEAVAYYDYWHNLGKLDSIEQIFKRVV